MKEKTRVGKFLQKTAPGLLKVAGDLTGVSALRNLGQIIQGNEDMPEEDKQTAMELLQMDISDRESARNMQVAALNQQDKFSKRFIYVFAGFWALFAAAYIVFITFGEVPEANTRFADTILGFLLGTIVAAIINFFFGSSSGSKEKDNGLLQNIQKR